MIYCIQQLDKQGLHTHQNCIKIMVQETAVATIKTASCGLGSTLSGQMSFSLGADEEAAFFFFSSRYLLANSAFARFP